MIIIKTGKVRLFLVASIMVTILAGALAYFNDCYYTENYQRLQNTNAFIMKTMELESMLKEAVSSVRGYMLTDDKYYLRPYHNYLGRIEKVKTSLLLIVQTNPEYKNDVDTILRLISDKEKFMGNFVLLISNAKRDEAMQQVRTGRGRGLMDLIKLKIAHILKKEKSIQKDYEENLKSLYLIRNVLWFSILFINICAIVLLSFKQRQNNILIRRLNIANTTLEKKVMERTKELQDVNRELQAQNKEIVLQTEQISKQNNELLQLNEEKNKFIGIVTHDLKNPINRIKGLVSIVQASASATVESQKEYFDMIVATITGMHKLISNVLDINRIDFGKTKIQLEAFDVVPFLENELLIFKEQASEKRITLTFDNEMPSLTIKSDKIVLLRILENLVSNAIKFSEKDKEVTLRVRQLEEAVQITVQDQGPGIAEEEKHLLFGKFQKLSTKPTAGESSSGLGLSIVKELVGLLKGKVYCESKVGEGSSFILELPV